VFCNSGSYLSSKKLAWVSEKRFLGGARVVRINLHLLYTHFKMNNRTKKTAL
jgi:hypothetical protein